jgi:hypothetical protein
MNDQRKLHLLETGYKVLLVLLIGIWIVFPPHSADESARVHTQTSMGVKP